MPLHASNVDDLNKLLFNFSRFSHFLNIWGVNFVWIGVCTLWNVYCQINWCCFCCFGEEPILPHPSPQLQQIKIFAQQGLGKKNPLKINFFFVEENVCCSVDFTSHLFDQFCANIIPQIGVSMHNRKRFWNIETLFQWARYRNHKFCIDNSNGL